MLKNIRLVRKTYTLILAFTLLILMVALVTLSWKTKWSISDLVQFVGAFFGASMAVIGASWAVEEQVQAESEREYQIYRQQQYQMEKIIHLLLVDEIHYNSELFINCLKNNQQKIPIPKFIIDNWERVKYDLILKFDALDILIPVLDLYNSLESLNRKIDAQRWDDLTNQENIKEIELKFLAVINWIESSD